MRKYKPSGGIFEPEKKSAEIARINSQMENQEIWSEHQKIQALMKKKTQIENSLKVLHDIEKMYEDVQVLLELWEEGNDVSSDIEAHINTLHQEIDTVELQVLLSEETDPNNAILIIHAGTGGTDAQDWAEILSRMYMRWSEKKGFNVKVLDKLVGEEAGIKSITLLITGRYAYGLLKCEIGIHRLVRISPFDANKRRHTSFASVFAYPEIDESIEVKIEEKDIKIDTFRAGGPGGQHVNVTDSAVRITHLPTGIVVQCQNERSQHRNKDVAMKILKSRLYEFYKQQQREKAKTLEDTKKDISWGNQIRSYVLHPYKMAKDHRTKYEKHDIEKVLDGDIDEFIKTFLVFLKDYSANEKEQSG
jgi:peptide chain release factor 2